MTIGVFVSTFQPMLKNDGTINAAGTLEFYEPGQSGSTAKVVYSDYLLTTSIGSTITLDSNARKVIYLNGNYDVIEKDSAGATIVSRSNINPDQSTAITDINIISNGSFETSANNIPSDWTLFEWNSGANVVDSSAGNFADGKYSMKFVSTGSGGGTLTTNSFFTVNEQSICEVSFLLMSTVDVRNIVQFLWYDKDQVALGTPSTSVYDDATANPTSWEQRVVSCFPPSGARFAKLKIIGCDSSDATSGTVRFDGVRVTLKDTVEGSVASAATVEIWKALGDILHVTGTTTITSLGTALYAGQTKRLIFDGALILTHAANLNIPGATNITTAAGDSCLAYADTTTQIDILEYTKANGKAVVDASIGVGQTWQTPGKVLNTEYQNTTGRPIMVRVVVSNFGALSIEPLVDDVSPPVYSLGIQTNGATAVTNRSMDTFIVPTGHYYRVNSGQTLDLWTELTV